MVDFRIQQGEHATIHIDEAAVEVKSFKFLSAHITDYLKWSTNTDRRLNKCVLTPRNLTNIYRCTIGSILLG